MWGRVVLLGMDALVLPLVKRFVDEGVLPHFGELLKGGAHSFALSVMPPYTPTNWATIATGALPGRHGAGNWTDVDVRDAVGRVALSTFDARALHADTIWNALSRTGGKSLLLTYPGSYPTRQPGVTVVAPLYRGLTGHALLPGMEYTVAIGADETLPLPSTNVTPGALVVPTEDGHQELHPVTSSHFSAFALARKANKLEVLWDSQPLVALEGAEWSEWVTVPDGIGSEASVRFRLLSDDGNTVTFLRSELYPIRGFTDPKSYADSVYDEVGPFFEHPVAIHRDSALAMNALLDEIQDQVDWYIGLGRHSAQHVAWDLFMTHWHWIDTAQHTFLAGLDPEDGVEPDDWSIQVIRRSYELGDRLLGGFMDQLGTDDHLIVVSDHGHVPNRRIASVARRLVECGLAVFDKASGRRQVIDRSRSRAYLLSPHELVVNLQGRNDGGIVPPDQYPAVVDEVMDALLDWRDSETGKRLVGYALPRRHQQLLGYFGDRTGDVMFLYNPGISWGTPKAGVVVGPADGSSNHGAQLPTTVTSRTANMASFLAWGPKIRPGYERNLEERGFISLTDVAPLMAHLLGIAPPLDCRGSVPWDILVPATR